MHSSIQYWLWLRTRQGLSPQTGRYLYEQMGRSVERLYLAEEDELEHYGLSSSTLASLLDKDLRGAHKIIEDCLKKDMKIITLQDAAYPNKIRNLTDPPLLLFYRGVLPLLDDVLSISMVGAREATAYGISHALEMSLTLSKAGVMMITGMAEGVDSAVIEGALKAGGPLVSVVAGGIDLTFPKESAQYYGDVATVGCIMSEYPPGTQHFARHFRPRNRILSGLSNGVCVVECLKRGGTMLTASIAEEQGRDLFAVPGVVQSPYSTGPHDLIQHHEAFLTTCAQDILQFYQEKYPLLLSSGLSQNATEARVAEAVDQVAVKSSRESSHNKKKSKTQANPKKEAKQDSGFIPLDQQKHRFTDDQIMLLHMMGDSPHSIDGLVELSQLPAKRVLSSVTMLEMDGALIEVAEGKYQAQVRLETDKT